MNRGLCAALVLLAMLAFAYSPAFAHTHSEHMHHGDESIGSVQEVPVGGHAASDKTSPCPLHETAHKAKCDAMKMLHCEMGNGCCIKGEGPLSSGSKEKTAGQEDDVYFSPALLPNVDGRFAFLPSANFQKLEKNFSPIPRPPSA